MEETQPTPVSIQDTSTTSQTVTISPDKITSLADEVDRVSIERIQTIRKRYDADEIDMTPSRCLYCDVITNNASMGEHVKQSHPTVIPQSDNIANSQDIEQPKHEHVFENGECVCGGLLVKKHSPQTVHSDGSYDCSCGENHKPKDITESVLSNDSAVAQIAQAVTQPVMQGVVVKEEKHPGGRPSKYNEGMLNKAKGYLAHCKGENDGKPKMPFMEELAMICDVDGDTLVSWANDENNKEFSATYKAIFNLQKLRILQRGFNAKNPTFAIFMLKANHGMMETEKQVLVQDRDVKVSITRE